MCTYLHSQIRHITYVYLSTLSDKAHYLCVLRLHLHIKLWCIAYKCVFRLHSQIRCIAYVYLVYAHNIFSKIYYSCS